MGKIKPPIEQAPAPVKPIAEPIAELKDPLQWEANYSAITVLRLKKALKPGDRILLASNVQHPVELVVRDTAEEGTNLIQVQPFMCPYFAPQRTLIGLVPEF